MKTIISKPRPIRKTSDRTRRKEIDRKRRKVWAMEIILPEHALDDLTRFAVHRYTLNPLCMAVRTSDVIKEHDLVRVDGERLKVVSVEAVSEGCLEIRTVKFERYQVKP